MSKKEVFPIGEYIVTAIATMVVLFSLSVCVQIQMYLNIEANINKREQAKKESIKLYSLIELQEKHRLHPEDYIITINLAKAYESVEKYATAEELYKSAIAASRNSNYAIFSYAVFCAKNGKHVLAMDLTEKFHSSREKIIYKYKTEIYEELAKGLDKEKEFEGSVKAYQIAYKYAKNIGDSKQLKKIAHEYAKEYIKLADYNIENKQTEDAILNLENSLNIKKLDVAKYKLALIYKDTNKILSEKYFSQVFEHNPYMVNPYIYNDILEDIIKTAKKENNIFKADLYSLKQNNLKNKMQEYYVYKRDILISKTHISSYKTRLGKNKRYTMSFDIKNNTPLDINNLYIKADIISNGNQYTTEKKAITGSYPLIHYEEMGNIELDLPKDFVFIDNDNKNKQNDLIVKYFVKKQKKAPWTLAKIEFMKF